MDIESLIRCFNGRHVDYVVIGAMAMPAHGYVRASLDIDLLIRPVEDNARRVLQALADFGYDVGDLSPAIVLTKKLLFRQYAIRTDIHPHVLGVDFERAWGNKVESRIGSTTFWVASLDDLIAMKEAAGRPRDIEDARALKAIKARLKTESS
jgi:hypothetical protein